MDLSKSETELLNTSLIHSLLCNSDRKARPGIQTVQALVSCVVTFNTYTIGEGQECFSCYKSQRSLCHACAREYFRKDWILYFWKSLEYCTPPNLNSLPIVPGWSFPPKCHFCSPSTWRTWAQLAILWEALSCHHFVLSQQLSDFHEKKMGFYKAIHGLKQFCLCWLCVKHLSTDVCRDVLVSLLLFVFMVVFTCYMYWGPNRVDPTRLQEPWVRHYLANTFLSRTECQGPLWTLGPQSMISNPDPEELTILVA